MVKSTYAPMLTALMFAAGCVVNPDDNTVDVSNEDGLNSTSNNHFNKSEDAALKSKRSAQIQARVDCDSGFLQHSTGGTMCFGDSRCSYQVIVSCDKFFALDYTRTGPLLQVGTGPSVAHCNDGDLAYNLRRGILCPIGVSQISGDGTDVD
jgi:hypothetical protein